MNQNSNMKLGTVGADSIPYKKWEKQFTSEHQKDFILPDTVDDAKRILCYNVMLRPDDSYISVGGKLEYSGELCCFALLLADSGELDGVEFSFDYSGSAAIPEEIAEDSSCAVNADIAVQSCALRLTNPRKLSARIRLAADTEAYAEGTAAPELTVNEGGKRSEASSSVAATVCRDEKTIRAARRSKIRAGRLMIAEDIELDRSYPEIGRVLYQTVSVVSGGAHGEEGGAVIEGELCYTCIYLHETAEEGGELKREYVTAVKRFPFSEKLALESFGGSTAAHLTVEGISANAVENSAGERRLIELDVTVGVELESCENIECSVTTDAFSTAFEGSCGTRHIDVSELEGVYSAEFNAVGKISDSALGEGERAAACFGRLAELSLERDSEAGEFMLAVGELDVTVLIESGGSYSSVESTVPFRARLTIPDPQTEGVESSVTAGIRALDCRTSDGGLEASAEISICALICGVTGEEIVSEVTLEMSKPHEGRRTPLTVYYPAPEERTFEIAKRYKVAPASVERLGEIAVITV